MKARPIRKRGIPQIFYQYSGYSFFIWFYYGEGKIKYRRIREGEQTILKDSNYPTFKRLKQIDGILSSPSLEDLQKKFPNFKIV